MTTQTSQINGIDIQAIRNKAAAARTAEDAATTFAVQTDWDGGFQSTSRSTQWGYGEYVMPRDAQLTLNTPKEMGGSATTPTPLEAYLAALNACLVVGLVIQCSIRGIEIRSLNVKTSGTVDARSFLAGDTTIAPGYPKLTCDFQVDADADQAVLREAFDTALNTSPNRANVTGPVPLEIDYRITSTVEQQQV